MADEILGHTPEEWQPMPPNMGPPLPSFLDIYWPWYKPSGQIALKSGWNEVVYTGKRQTAEKALASIMDYLVICYYRNADTQNWELVTTDTIMVTGETYWISVTQDCTWTF